MIISGKEISAGMKSRMAAQVAELASKYGRAPQLTVILVGDDPASATYVAGKARISAEIGIDNRTIHLSASTSEKELLDNISQLAADESVDGILVQLPLPAHICEERVIDAIPKEKDVDGFHPLNVAALHLGRPCIYPCTAKGIMIMLEQSGIKICGARAVVVGRSNIVGKPVAKMLLNANATVTTAHSRTKDLGAVTRDADILVVAVGKAKLITADMVKPGAVIIDVGINRDPATGKLCGDVDFDACSKIASAISPVPGGVGPMTLACLMDNTIECFINRQHK